MNLGSQVLMAVRWAVGAKFLSQLVSWGVSIVVIRLLTPEDYGLMTMATVFTSFLMMLNEFGLGAAIVQRGDLDEQSLCQVFGLILAVNFLLFILLNTVSPLVADFFGERRLIPILQILSLQFIADAFGIIPQALLERKLDFKTKSLVDVSSTVVSAIITLVLALVDSGVWALVWGSLALAVLKSAGLNFVSPYLRRPAFSLSGLRTVVSFGGIITVTRVAWLFYSQADIFVIGKLLGKEQLGLYAVAMQLASLPMQKMNSIINLVAFPAFARIQTEPESIKANLLKAIRVMSFVAFPVFLGISCLAKELVAVILGPTWQSAVLPLQLLTLVMTFRMISNLLHSTVQGLGRPEISVIKLLIASVIMPLAFFVASNGGVIGVCLAWVFVYPIIFLIMLWLSLPVVGVRWAEFFNAIAGPTLAGIGMYIIVAMTRSLFLEGMIPPMRLVTLVVVGMVAYGGAVIALYSERTCEVFELVKRSLSRRVATIPS